MAAEISWLGYAICLMNRPPKQRDASGMWAYPASNPSHIGIYQRSRLRITSKKMLRQPRLVGYNGGRNQHHHE
jgi:hypothetical protein